nr:uncharacterized protein LOC116827409 isoform X4 [Chelonoidis abingdonii]
MMPQDHCLSSADKMHTGPEIPSPILNCSASDILGASICAIISLDYDSMLTVCERLSGKLLPKTLREFIWTDKLLKADAKVDKFERIIILEREARVKFGRTVEHQIAKLKIRSDTRSPISGLIENAVVEKYEKTPCMHSFATNEHMISETSKTLNVLYVFNGTWEPYLIYWLFPLQMAFKQIMPTAEHPYELAMYLHFLHQNLFPSWTETFAMAEWMMSLLEREDTEFFTHLQQCFRKNFAVDPKNFLVELIVREREKVQELYTATDRSEQNIHLTKELLASRVIFLRKWMDEVFLFYGCHLLTADIQRPGFIFSKVVYHLTSLGLAGKIKGQELPLFYRYKDVLIGNMLLKLKSCLKNKQKQTFVKLY